MVMDPVTIAGLAGAGASFVGGLVNNAWADARSDKQWQRTLYMQDKMNAYNAPVAQMERLAQAGLNPNLVYGNGGSVIQSAGGNAPNPPNTTPIDTQGVLQMVQTIVGAMLEKDKIQASKEMQSESIKSQEHMHDASIQSQEGMQEKSIKSQEGMQEKSIQSQEGMQEKSIQSSERIAFANLSESARQADMRNAIDRAHVAVDRYMATIAKYRADTEAMESYSRKALNEQQYRLHESLDELTVAVERGKIREQQIRNGITEIQDFLSRPGSIDTTQLAALYDKYGIVYNQSQLNEIKSVFDKLHHRMGIDATMSDNYVTPFVGELSNAILKPLSVLK